MPLMDGYGVLLGTLAGYRRDDPNEFGRYMHGVLTVAAPGGRYTCAVDVDTRDGKVPIHWRIQPLRSAEWAGMFALPDGWHPLASTPDSGAVDYIRDPRLRDMIFVPSYAGQRSRLRDSWPGQDLPHQAPVWTPAFRGGLAPAEAAATPRRAPIVESLVAESSSTTFPDLPGDLVMVRPPWNEGSSEEALVDLEAVIAAPLRIAIFGEPFSVGKGVHNIHQNQGDTIGGGHNAESGIWQDGVTIALRSDGTASAFMNKFDGQANATNNSGHPV